MFRWFPELSTSYSKLKYGFHRPLPVSRDPSRIPVQSDPSRSNPCLIKLTHSSPNQSFTKRYRQTLTEKLIPLLSRTTLRKAGNAGKVGSEKKMDKDRPGPGYERSRRGKCVPNIHPNVKQEPSISQSPTLPTQNVTSAHGAIDATNQDQLVIYVFEPTTEHPQEIFEIQNREELNKELPDEWKNRTTFKFIPAAYLSVVRSNTFDQIANEVFQQVRN